MTTTAMPTSGEATAEDYDAYQKIVQLMSGAITEGVNNALQQLKDPAKLTETVSESMASRGEATPDQAEISHLLDVFWKYATGLDAKLCWRSVAGLPERSYMDVRTVQPPAEATVAGQEFSIGVSAFGIGVGVSW